MCFSKNKNIRLIISYADNRSKQDAYNRQKGLRQFEKIIKSGRLTISSINNRGYNKYLKMVGKVHIEVDYSKYKQDVDFLKWTTNKTNYTKLLSKNFNVLQSVK